MRTGPAVGGHDPLIRCRTTSQTAAPHAAHAFPADTPGERVVDAILHVGGAVGAGIGCLWLLVVRACGLPGAERLSLFICTGALTGTLLASALIAAACHFAAVVLETRPDASGGVQPGPRTIGASRTPDQVNVGYGLCP